MPAEFDIGEGGIRTGDDVVQTPKRLNDTAGVQKFLDLPLAMLVQRKGLLKLLAEELGGLVLLGDIIADRVGKIGVGEGSEPAGELGDPDC